MSLKSGRSALPTLLTGRSAVRHGGTRWAMPRLCAKQVNPKETRTAAALRQSKAYRSFALRFAAALFALGRQAAAGLPLWPLPVTGRSLRRKQSSCSTAWTRSGGGTSASVSLCCCAARSSRRMCDPPLPPPLPPPPPCPCARCAAHTEFDSAPMLLASLPIDRYDVICGWSSAAPMP